MRNWKQEYSLIGTSYYPGNGTTGFRKIQFGKIDMKLAAIIAFLLLTASLAGAVTYKWEDKKGIHFSDDFNSVPAELRTRAVPEDVDGVINFGKLRPFNNGSGVRQKNLQEIERVDEERDRIVMEGIRQHQSDMINQMYQQSSNLQTHLIRLFAQRMIIWIAPLLLFLYLWLQTLVDIMNSEFTVPAHKYRWLVVVLLFAPFGMAAYYLRGRARKAALHRMNDHR